jgi:hypothetical protein
MWMYPCIGTWPPNSAFFLAPRIEGFNEIQGPSRAAIRRIQDTLWTRIENPLARQCVSPIVRPLPPKETQDARAGTGGKPTQTRDELKKNKSKVSHWQYSPPLAGILQFRTQGWVVAWRIATSHDALPRNLGFSGTESTFAGHLSPAEQRNCQSPLTTQLSLGGVLPAGFTD